MAFKSKAQREKLKQLAREGKFPQAKFDEMEAIHEREKLKGKTLPDVALTKPKGLVRGLRRPRT